MDTTGKELVQFWEYAAEKNLINRHTALARRTAAAQVLSVMDDWETLDVATLDGEEVFRRFTNKMKQRFTPGSLATYKTRFKSAVSEFLDYVKKPEAWTPKSAARATTNGGNTKSEKRSVATEPMSAAATGASTTGPVRSGLIEYPYPLREGQFAFLRLPADLKASEVKRLVGFLNTLTDEG